MPISSAFAVSGGGAPAEQSASCVIAKAESGSHTLTIDGYSRIKKESGRSWGNWISSATFTAGGHSWSADFLYDWDGHDRAWKIFMLLRLRCTDCSDGEEVSAAYKFSLLDQNGRPSYVESSGEVDTFSAAHSCGARCVISCTFLDSRATAATYLHDDCLRVRCDVTVYRALRCEDRDVPARLVAVPPPDMGEQLGRLLSSRVGADLTFEVTGETFAAHRYILAVRSPVFLEEIVSGGLTKSKTMEAATCGGIEISGVEARVFKALLHYIYTDSLPEIDEDETTDMARRLIAVADRYGLDRLKLLCADMLCRRVDTSRVADTLAVSEEYNCHGLKKACVQFLVSGSNLKAAMAAGGFERLRSSCPSVLKDLLAIW